MQRLLLDAASTKQGAVVSAGSVADKVQMHSTPAGTDELDPARVNRVIVTTSRIEDSFVARRRSDCQAHDFICLCYVDLSYGENSAE